MAILQSILMGIIQGLTEFLPVSSSGHLVFISSLCKAFCGHEVLITGQQEVFFDIVLHVGSLIAVLIYFKKDLSAICVDLRDAFIKKDFSSSGVKLSFYLLIGTICTVAVAFPLKDISEKLVGSPSIVGGFIFATGWILFLSDIISKKIKKIEKVGLKEALLIGVVQGLAAFPGISRSGSTISAGLLLGLDRVTSARYSFLLSILIIMGTSIFFPILEFSPSQIASFDWTAILIGFLVSAVVSYFCIKYFLQFLGKHSMKCFAYYCWFMGIFMMVGFHFLLK